MKNIRHYLLLSLFVVTACGTSTSITGSYKDSAAPKETYNKVFVVAISDRAAARQTVEKNLAQLMASRGAATVKSSDALPPNFRSGDATKDKNLLLSKINETNCDGILTVSLIRQDNETRYVPGTTNYYPMGAGYYGGFGSYYAYGYSNYYSPGYYTDDKIYYLEANLYDAASEKLVWSAQSKTYNPTSLDDFLEGYTKALAEQMNKDGIMTPPAKK
jgi:hypothetical protein